ncbi:hypothetical protein DCS_00018 [Drechmeria coniospora]|uniref:WW domain-containing protein n=1 Tax=Drechmeria coniospora TaxID=98403 RepID=A0A151GPA3_DRECN|nr:hypothetical protein DCS_00018 [Drechmeria coniospora]KYK58891.1 hypothetical protein DCS_00018 [Drechmeria coniospora]
MYARYARSSRSGIGAVESVDVGHGAKGHWIGDKNARNVLIWYHGGGFCLPANVGYFKFWSQLVGSSSAAGKDLAVFALTYDLAPHERYPTQHRQAVEALRYILTETKRRPGEVLLGGDSAGGNMAIGVLSHLAHSHPAMEELKVAEPLAGLVVVAPWTSLDESHGESDIYYKGDLLSPRIVLPWARAFLGDGVRDFYTDASDAPSSWFEPFPVKHVLVTAGENECLMPIVEDLFAKMKAAIPSAELFVGEREAHVAPVFNLYVRDSTETLQGKKIKAWLREVL